MESVNSRLQSCSKGLRKFKSISNFYRYNDTSTTQPPPPLPLINVGLPLKQRLGHCPTFKATLSEGEGGVKVCCSSGGVFLK